MLPFIAAAATAYGQYRANRQNKAAASNAMAIEQRNAKRQMRFQERMSNTAHQRQMKDLRRAGINPMLSAKLGGASSPSGAMGKGYTYQAGNIGAAGVEGYSKISSAKQAQSQTRLTNIQADIAQSSPKAVVSKIIGAIEKGLTGRRVRGAYAPFSEIASNIVKRSGEYTKGENWPDIEPMLTPRLVAEVIKQAGKFGIEVPAEILEMAIDAIKGK